MTEAAGAREADGPVRQMVVGVGALVVIDAVGGAVAISTGINTPAEAYRWRDRRGAVAAGALSLACLVSAASGFFDGGLGNSKVPDSVAPVQWLLVGATAVVGVLAAQVAGRLWRRG